MQKEVGSFWVVAVMGGGVASVTVRGESEAGGVVSEDSRCLSRKK